MFVSAELVGTTRLYNTKEEAEAAAPALGCTGAHSMGEDLWMPCSTHGEGSGDSSDPYANPDGSHNHTKMMEELAKQQAENPDLFCAGAGTVMLNGFTDNMGICITYLFENWNLNSPLKFSLACIGTVLIGIIVQCFSRFKSELEKSFEQKRIRDGRLYISLLEGAASSICVFLIITFGYLLMLLTMTYSLPLFFSVVVGLGAGHFVAFALFRQYGLYQAAKAASANANKNGTEDGNNKNRNKIHSSSLVGVGGVDEAEGVMMGGRAICNGKGCDRCTMNRCNAMKNGTGDKKDLNSDGSSDCAKHCECDTSNTIGTFSSNMSYATSASDINDNREIDEERNGADMDGIDETDELPPCCRPAPAPTAATAPVNTSASTTVSSIPKNDAVSPCCITNI